MLPARRGALFERLALHKKVECYVTMKPWVETHSTMHADIQLTVADLQPVQGLSDQYDDAIFALCMIDSCPQVTSSMPIDNRFCHQLRRAVDADTVYLCDRQTLKILATTSTTTGVDADTQTLHAALTSMVSDLQNCSAAVHVPDIRVFTDQEKLNFAVIPVGTADDKIAVVVDADHSIRNFNQYYADCVRELYSCHTTECYKRDPYVTGVEISPPTTREIQTHIFDGLNRRYRTTSARINERRFEIFSEDLQKISVQFEKIQELENSGHTAVWGWEVVAVHQETDLFPQQLFATAEEWGEQFRTALDLHTLTEAAYRYKTVCEAENLIHFSDTKPLCISVYPQTLQQPDYIAMLRDLTEKVVTHGARLVFEISEKLSLASDNSVESLPELNSFATQLQALRDEFGIRIALDAFGEGNSSLSRFICLEPDIVKIDRSVLSGNGNKLLELLKRFSELSGKRGPLEIIMESVEHESIPEQSDKLSGRQRFHSRLGEHSATA
ncbi:hypothetical protein AB833_07800 [Chromatiales bacterium (ex Bugula neritina AB1)]|nr:hypothetical protein AB833_07800 [Chromatiales bacterium (ex Bugula neritina AB1)]